MKPINIYLTPALVILLMIGCIEDAVSPNESENLFLLDSPTAMQEHNIPDLKGDWHGLTAEKKQDDQNEGVDKILKKSSLKVTGQDKRRFSGKLQKEDQDFAMKGTVSNSEIDVVQMVFEGMGTSPGVIPGHYKLQKFGNKGAALLRGGLLKERGEVKKVKSPKILLKQFTFDPSAGPPALVGGNWKGTFVSENDGEEREVEANFDQSDVVQNRFTGSLNFLGENNLLEGSIDEDGNIVFVGMGVGTSPGIVPVIQAIYIPGTSSGDDVGPPAESARIVGTYVTWCAISPNMLVDFGTFEISEILVGL